MQRFATVVELERALQSFKHRYYQQWLVAKHDYRTPLQARMMLTLEPAA